MNDKLSIWTTGTTGKVIKYIPRRPISLVFRCRQATPNSRTSSLVKSKAASSETGWPSERDEKRSCPAVSYGCVSDGG